jgi:Dot/Icm secretion system protein IcmQ
MQSMNLQKENLLKLSQQLVNDLDKLLETGNWEESLFLRAMSKSINAIREEAQELKEKLASDEATTITAQNPTPFQLKEDYIKVYISLYQADGGNLSLWQNMLKSLAKYCVSRPIYTNEAHAQALIQSKSDSIRHAYAVVAVKKNELMPSEIQKTDSLGHKLFALKEQAIDIKNIVNFVHANKNIYTFHDNKLHLENTIS